MVLIPYACLETNTAYSDNSPFVANASMSMTHLRSLVSNSAVYKSSYECKTYEQ